MHIRKYQPGEERELWELFFHTVRNVNIQDYTPEQVQVWAPEGYAAARWGARIAGNDPFVCLDGDVIVGFADLQASGQIDQFFVHHQWQGRGVGKRLFAAIEVAARQQDIETLTSHVSRTARAFFESRGFSVIETQEVFIGDTVFENFKMVKRLGCAASD